VIETDKILSERGIDPTIWVDEHGDYLFNFALMRVRDESTAEDLVQETLLSAFQSLKSYKGKSSEKTWLTSILKYKIIDHYRKHKRETKLDEDVGELDKFFERKDEWNGHWNREFAPKSWNATPETVLEKSEFRMVLTNCLMKLPERTANTFTLNQIDGLSCEEIGDILGVTTNNCWVLLHRARLHLRQCIESNWFRKE
jgi:RNA polymerase sigma-70 factor (ECF subfamily)